MSENANNRKERIKSLIEKLNEGLLEREYHIAVALLAAVAGLNVFLLGPPGTAKSLLARRIKSAFADSQEPGNYFEYLMQRFSTPDELFGPVSLTALKEDRYTRKTEGFLPSAHFAFLDEIWKSGPGILNTLLTLINEKLFRNGADLEKAPLKMLITASNETPPPGQGLEALYDRFIIRMYVPPVSEVRNFEQLLKSGEIISDKIDCGDLAITPTTMNTWQKAIRSVVLTEDTLRIIHAVRLTLEEQTDEIYVSERRWKQATHLLKAAAFFSGRLKTNIVDASLLKHCLWTKEENRIQVMELVEDAIRKSGFQMEISDDDIVREKEQLADDIAKNLYDAKNKAIPVHPSVIEFYQKKVGEFAKKVDKLIDDIELQRMELAEEIDTPFVPPEKQKIALEGVEMQANEIQKHKEECMMLQDRVNNAESNE